VFQCSQEVEPVVYLLLSVEGPTADQVVIESLITQGCLIQGHIAHGPKQEDNVALTNRPQAAAFPESLGYNSLLRVHQIGNPRGNAPGFCGPSLGDHLLLRTACPQELDTWIIA